MSAKKIPLTQGKFAIVDAEDFNFLNQWKWFFSDGGYTHRSQYIRIGKGSYTSKIIRMHRIINNTSDGKITDHINRNKLDNRKSNLRTVNKSLNSLNRAAPKNNKSGKTGVSFENWSCTWRAEIKINGKKIRLGRFEKLVDAIKARELAEKKYGI